MQGSHGAEVSIPSSSLKSLDKKLLHSSSEKQLKQPAVLYIRSLVDVDKPVTVVFRQAAYVHQPEEPG